MIKTLAKSIREYKTPSILSPIFVAIEVVLECLMPLVIMDFLEAIRESEVLRMSTIFYYGGILKVGS